MRLFILFLILVVCFSCSLSTQKEIVEISQKEQQPEFIFKDVQKKLDILTKEAKKTGEKAVVYLMDDLYIKAFDASIRGDPYTASFLYGYILKIRHDDHVSKKYALELIKIGRLTQSGDILARLFEKNKDRSIGLILANIYLKLNKMNKARKVYHRLISSHREQTQACILLSKSYSQEKKYKTANGILDNCLKKNKQAVYLYYKGKIALKRKRKKEAMGYFNQALKLDSDYTQAIIGKGLIYEEKHQNKKAVRLYENHLKTSPDSHVVVLRLIQLFLMRGELKKAIPYLEELAYLDHNNENLKMKLAMLYMETQKFEKARGIFNEILLIHKDSDQVLYYLGILNLRSGDQEKALSHFKKIQPTDNLFLESSIQMADILLSQAGETSESASRFINFIEERSRQRDELKVDLNVLLARFHEERNDYKSAILTLEKFYEEKNFNEEYKYYLAGLYEKNREFKKSRRIIQAILDKDPDNPHALNFLGYSLLETGEDMELAYRYIAKAFAIRPNDGFIRDSLGWYYYKKGDLYRALKEVKQAWLQVGDDMIIAKHLAIIYKDLKNYKMARRYFTEALKHCRIKSEREKLKKFLNELKKLRLPAQE